MKQTKGGFDKGKPSLCMNPPLYMDLKIRMNLPQTYDIKGCSHIHIISGTEDDVVNPFKTFDWLTENKPTADFKLINGMGHRFDLDRFISFTKPIMDNLTL